jgi:serine/threonine protein kinase
MGSKNSNKKSNKNNIEEKVSRASFEYLQIIGKGGFGKVWKVYSRKFKSNYAMKEMSKSKIIDKKSEKSVKAERDLLAIMNHPFIINMHFAFQDKDNLYIIMDYLTGGDLRYHICKHRKFSETQSKFFIACILLSLEYIHANNIIHRDLKPENLVLDKHGYVKLTDFGIAKKYKKENYKETSGTPGYMAPEVMCAQNHTIAVDYFALGVICYEFMYGIRPYLGKSRKEIKEKMMAKQVEIRKSQIPKNWSVESADFINRLLKRKPIQRLGLRGSKEVKEHSWFKYFNWKDLYLNRIDSGFKPKDDDNFDHKYCNSQDKIGINTQERYYNIINSQYYKNIFDDFNYFNRYSNLESENEKNKSSYIINPHLVYLEDNFRNIEFNHLKKSKSLIHENFNNNNFINKMKPNDKYFQIRRFPSAVSSSLLFNENKFLNNDNNNYNKNNNDNNVNDYVNSNQCKNKNINNCKIMAQDNSSNFSGNTGTGTNTKNTNEFIYFD